MDDPGAFDLHQPCPKLVAFRGPDVRDPRLRKVHSFFFSGRARPASPLDAGRARPDAVQKKKMKVQDYAAATRY
jgi:hypothetical protein